MRGCKQEKTAFLRAQSLKGFEIVVEVRRGTGGDNK